MLTQVLQVYPQPLPAMATSMRAHSKPEQLGAIIVIFQRDQASFAARENENRLTASSFYRISRGDLSFGHFQRCSSYF